MTAFKCRVTVSELHIIGPTRRLVSVQTAAEMISRSHRVLVTSLTSRHFILLTLHQLHWMKLTWLVKLVVSEISFNSANASV